MLSAVQIFLCIFWISRDYFFVLLTFFFEYQKLTKQLCQYFNQSLFHCKLENVYVTGSSKETNWPLFPASIRVFHDKEIWHISVRLPDRSKVRQNKINFIKNCPQWGLNSQLPDHDSNALPTELGRNLLDWRFLKWAFFVSCTTSIVGLCSFL